ncbi:MAG TPA: hypothetical protein DCG19_02795 [Cryomorphaceae bacterium]|nr:hypothetical protein [Owenweeksia sp.]MBF98803.1 hypothetical protein [Owenweeksia sp.]HAD96303.1 hypothetical protein [Cryomorphaceae bacterium]HBF20031.1 hypothetical protein [Cryomorphaceae bacterium]
MSFLKNKPLLLVFLLLIGIGGFFWTQSRYPALDEKAIMEGSVSTSGIGFDVVMEVDPTDSWWMQTVAHTANWYHTNWKGMTFGILFAAALMLLFTLIKDWQSNNRFVNAFFGLLFGAPLGVCVNCAAPIAQGASKSGAKVETSLAMMLSSPTLNVIVLTMLFSLFPFYVALLKLGLTLGFILIGVPIISYLFGKAPVSVSDLHKIEDRISKPAFFALSLPDTGLLARSWGGAFSWTFTSYFKALWYIIRTTVPLMLLAGLLGAIMITVLPWNTFAEMLPQSNLLLIISAMLVLGLIGVFLPVPMSFDVIIVSTLVAGGLPIHYSMVLLFTLGIFSVYSFLITRQAISSKVAVSTALGVVLVGVMGGLAAQGLEDRYFDYFEKEISVFSKRADSKPLVIQKPELENVNKGPALTMAAGDTILVSKQGDVTIHRIPFKEQVSEGDALFSVREGWEAGIDPPYEFSALKVIQPYSDGRSIATGDVNGDGWTDILLSGDKGINLFLNKGGGQYFEEQKLTIPLIDTNWIGNAVLVDMNNDDYLDIVLTTYWYGNYILYSKNGAYSAENIAHLPNENEAPLTVGLSFGDVNKDGKLDMALGNFSLGVNSVRNRTYYSSRDALLVSNTRGWTSTVLDEMSGETLSALVTDFNMDGNPDLIFGIDFNIPDMYYLGNGAGAISLVSAKDKLVQGSLKRTMSIASEDIDNDLSPEIFLTQISELGFDTKLKVRDEQEAFASIKRKKEREQLQRMFRMKNQLAEAAIRADISQCDDSILNDCVALAVLKHDQFLSGRRRGVYPEGWKELEKMYYHQPREDDQFISKERMSFYLENPELSKENALLKRNSTGQFTDVARDYGLASTSWTWNGKFADLNNDEYKDLYAVNGTFYRSHNRMESNVLMINEEGKHFKEQTAESGLINYLPANSYTYVDLDNDGDMDIVSVPAIGPVYIYTNNTSGNKAVQFELHDEKGNRAGIGSKVFIYYGNDHHQMKEVQLGGGFRSFDAPLLHFGLGEHEKVSRVEIVWSTGERTVIDQELSSGNRYIISRTQKGEVLWAGGIEK